MTIATTGIIPEHMLFGNQLFRVMDFIKKLPAEGDFKRELLRGWAITVGVRLQPSQLNAVYQTGTDQWEREQGA